jgi:hypothetical protein
MKLASETQMSTWSNIVHNKRPHSIRVLSFLPVIVNPACGEPLSMNTNLLEPFSNGFGFTLSAQAHVILQLALG